jgi:hypothetical protein
MKKIDRSMSGRSEKANKSVSIKTSRTPAVFVNAGDARGTAHVDSMGKTTRVPDVGTAAVKYIGSLIPPRFRAATAMVAIPPTPWGVPSGTTHGEK